MPNRGSRAASGPWGRLRPIEQDPLETLGLPSKGDDRLLDMRVQEQYYTRIVERYMTFCSDAGQRDELLRRFSSLGISDSAHGTDRNAQSAASLVQPATLDVSKPANTRALADVLTALRKLREGIVASKRVDDFAVQAYLFCIRLSILVKQPEAYHPALLHLLRNIHPLHPLTPVELQEVVAYLILDAACRRKELSEAFTLRQHYGLQDGKVDGVLDALTHDNYVMFQRISRGVNGHQAKLLEWVEKDVRLHALKCFGRSYLSVDVDFLEIATGAKWAELRQNDGVGWELNDKKVVIRKTKSAS